jgi:hypothetical protein
MVVAAISEFDSAVSNCQNSSFDIQAAIKLFVANDGCSSLEFPSSLTSAERRQAKLVAEQYPELKCESYGFDNDRRLYLFKRSATTYVRVKNTFIDGLDANENNKDDEPFFYRTMPVLHDNNDVSSSQSCNGKLELPPLSRKFLAGLDDVTPQSTHAATPRSSHDATSQSSSGCDTPDLIIRSDSYTSDVPMTAPPGVFRYPVGSQVVIQGLVKLPTFNGLVGVVHSLDEETGRYDVLLACPSGGQQWTKVKYENLISANLVNKC